MRELMYGFLARKISRRQFGQGLAALGLSSAAVDSVVNNLAVAQQAPPPGAGTPFTGTGAEVLVETLRAADIRYVFGTTSTGMSAIFDAMALRPDPEMILSLAESQATSMAQGYELATGRPSALLVPGVAVPSTMNNLYNAWKDRSGILVIADNGSNRFEARNGFQQMENWLESMVSFTKWRWEIRNTEQVAEFIRRGLKLAATPPGAPVHLRISHDILGAKNVKTTIHPQERFQVPLEMRPKPELIEAAARSLLEAKSPMICAGAEITRAGATDRLVELAELLGIQVAQGYSVFNDFPFRHPLFAGFYGLGVPRDLPKTDVFVNLGGPMPDPTIFTAPPPRSAKIIHARIEFEEIGNTYPTDIPIAAGIGETLDALTDAVKGMATAERLQQIAGERLAAAREKQARADKLREESAKKTWNDSPMSWERVSFELEAALEEDAIIVPELDYRTPFEWLNLDRRKKRLIGQTTGFALGWGIGAAIGVKIAKPDSQVVCMTGDGALLFGQVEALWTAARYQIPIIIVVMNNKSYDNERNRIQNLSPLLANQDTKDLWKDITGYLGNPDTDFAGLAKSFSIPAERAETPAAFKAALKRARSVTREGRPYLIDAVIMQLDRRGAPTVQTWHPDTNIARLRTRKV
jgi:thiamine pyrophosphate-dependent acetolactate synthase large subunit-like protein